MARRRHVDIQCTVVKSSDLAWRVYSHSTGVTDWVPKSVSQLDPEVDAGPWPADTCITMPGDMALEKGLI